MSNSPPRISIVTPSFNQAEYLEECIDSVLGQGYPNLEYIIMDGGSSDRSVEIIKRYERYLTYWQSRPDGGHYQAINQGFSRTTGEIMAWLNSDDKYHPNAFLKAAWAFTEHPGVNWITGRAAIWDQAGILKSMDIDLPYHSRKKFLQRGYDKPFIIQEATFWRRRLWIKAGGMLDTQYRHAADLELWLRFFRYCPVRHLNAFLGGFRQHGDQRSINQNMEYHQEALQAVTNEVLASSQNDIFEPMPPPIIFTPERNMAFARSNNIPVSAGKDYLLNSYLNSIELWIEKVGREGYLSAVPVIGQELMLLDENISGRVPALKRQLELLVDTKSKAERLIKEGEEAFAIDDIATATRLTKLALDLWPSSAVALNNLGVLHNTTSNSSEALTLFVAAIEQNSYLKEAYINLALALLQRSERENATITLDNYLFLVPDDADMMAFRERLVSWL